MRRRISITAESAEETLHNRHTGEEPAPYSVAGPVSRGGTQGQCWRRDTPLNRSKASSHSSESSGTYSGQLKTTSNDLPSLGQRRYLPRRHHLHENVAGSRRLHRPHDDRTTDRVGRELIEQEILAASPNDMQRIHTAIDNALNCFERHAIPEREALQDRPHKFPAIGRRFLTRLRTEFRNASRHVPRRSERWVVWIDHSSERRGRLGHLR